MLDRVTAELKRDKKAALEKMKGGDKAFRDRDLYPFCIGPDGKTTAHAAKERIGEKAARSWSGDRHAAIKHDRPLRCYQLLPTAGAVNSSCTHPP